jgi:two-component system, OmpR family, response regulator
MARAMTDHRVDLLVLDVMLPGEDGLSLCHKVRAESHVPIIMLTARGEDVDRIVGLEMGADDYMPSPSRLRAWPLDRACDRARPWRRAVTA